MRMFVSLDTDRSSQDKTESNHSDKAQILRGPAPNLFLNYSLLLLSVLFVLNICGQCP
jgi:hypothetical protein